MSENLFDESKKCIHTKLKTIKPSLFNTKKHKTCVNLINNEFELDNKEYKDEKNIKDNENIKEFIGINYV